MEGFGHNSVDSTLANVWGKSVNNPLTPARINRSISEDLFTV